MKKEPAVKFLSRFNSNTVELEEDIYISKWNIQNLLFLLPFITYNPEIMFTGTFNGNGHTIHNVYFQMFDVIGDSGVFKNVTIKTDSNIPAESLICSENHGEIKNVDIEFDGLFIGNRIGGFVLDNYGDIINCSFVGKVNNEIDSKYADEAKAGITTENRGLIKQCEVESELDGDTKCGGIAILNFSEIIDCTVTNTEIHTNTDCAAGICSSNSETISRCTVTETEISSRTGSAGGITGQDTGKICQCEVENAHIESVNTVGGISGDSTNLINKCVVRDGVTIEGMSDVGGIVGICSGKIAKSIFEGNLQGMSFVGGISGSVEDSTIVTSVISTNEPTFEKTGGQLFGRISEEDIDIENCHYWTEKDSLPNLVGSDNRSETKGVHHNTNISKQEALCIAGI